MLISVCELGFKLVFLFYCDFYCHVRFEIFNKISSSSFSGPLFDLKEFHKAVLRNSGVPLRLLGDIVDRWIDDVKNAQTKSECSNGTSNNAHSTTGFLIFLLNIIVPNYF